MGEILISGVVKTMSGEIVRGGRVVFKFGNFVIKGETVFSSYDVVGWSHPETGRLYRDAAFQQEKVPITSLDGSVSGSVQFTVIILQKDEFTGFLPLQPGELNFAQLYELAQEVASEPGQTVVDYIRALHKGEWDTDETYANGDLVTHEGAAWVSLVNDNQGNEPGLESDEWALFVDRGFPGAGFNPEGEWAAQEYDAGAVVRHETGAYVAIEDTEAGDVPGVSVKWMLLVQDGTDGADGEDGEDGEDGIGVPDPTGAPADQIPVTDGADSYALAAGRILPAAAPVGSLARRTAEGWEAVTGDTEGQVLVWDGEIWVPTRELRAALGIAGGNPASVTIYDSCRRNLAAATSVYGKQTDSGHLWELFDVDGTAHTLNYAPGGYIEGNGAINSSGPLSRSSALVGGTVTGRYARAQIIARHTGTTQWRRHLLLRFIDRDNWLSVSIRNQDVVIHTCIDGVPDEIGSWSGLSAGIYPGGGALPVQTYTLAAEVYDVHTNFAASGRAMRVYYNGTEVAKAPLSAAAVAILDSANGRVGIHLGMTTRIFGLNFTAYS